MKNENTYTATGVISFLFGRKQLLLSVVTCLIGLCSLIIGMIVCDKSFWNYMFVWLLPSSGIVLLGVYVVSMTDRHPIILIFPPIVFFASLFIRFLVTYDYLTFTLIFIQSIPYFVFWLNIIKKKYYKETYLASNVGILSVLCVLTAIVVVNIMDHADVISLPFSEHSLLELLSFIELGVAFLYVSIGFINKDLQLKELYQDR